MASGTLWPSKVREASNAAVPLAQPRTLVCIEVLTVSVKAHSSCSFRTFWHDWTINHLKKIIQNHNDNKKSKTSSCLSVFDILVHAGAQPLLSIGHKRLRWAVGQQRYSFLALQGPLRDERATSKCSLSSSSSSSGWEPFPNTHSDTFPCHSLAPCHCYQ